MRPSLVFMDFLKMYIFVSFSINLVSFCKILSLGLANQKGLCYNYGVTYYRKVNKPNGLTEPNPFQRTSSSLFFFMIASYNLKSPTLNKVNNCFSYSVKYLGPYCNHLI